MMPKGGKAFRNIFFVRMPCSLAKKELRALSSENVIGVSRFEPVAAGWEAQILPLCYAVPPNFDHEHASTFRATSGWNEPSFFGIQLLSFFGGPFNEQQKYYTPFLSEEKSASQEKARPSLEALGPWALGRVGLRWPVGLLSCCSLCCCCSCCDDGGAPHHHSAQCLQLCMQQHAALHRTTAAAAAAAACCSAPHHGSSSRRRTTSTAARQHPLPAGAGRRCAATSAPHQRHISATSALRCLQRRTPRCWPPAWRRATCVCSL